MNDQRSFEQFVADNVATDAVGRPMPDDFYDEMHQYASTHRHRLRWLALIKEPPMRTNSKLAVGSPMVRVVAIMAATILLGMLVAGAGIAGQQLLAADGTIVVNHDGSGDFTTVNEAIAAAKDGDEILVMPGEYEEAVRISKDITLRGEDRDTVTLIVGQGCVTQDTGSNEVACPDGTPMYDGYWNGVGPYGILVDHAEARVSDLTIETRVRTESLQNEALAWAITAVGGAPTFDRVLTRHFGDGASAYVHGGSAAAFLNSEFRGAVFVEEQSPVTLIGNSVRGIVIVNADITPPSGSVDAQVTDNTLSLLTFAGPVKVAGNTFTGAAVASLAAPITFRNIADDAYAIAIDDGDGWSISDNEIDGYTYGIRQSGGPGGDVIGNTIVDSGIGIRVAIGAEYRVAENRVEGGSVGILVGGAGLVEDNEVTEAKNVGFVIETDSTVTLTGNTSCDNGQDLTIGTDATPTIDDTNTICDGGPEGS